MKISDLIDRYVELSRKLAEFERAICKLTSSEKINKKTMEETNNGALKMLNTHFESCKHDLEMFKKTEIKYVTSKKQTRKKGSAENEKNG